MNLSKLKISNETIVIFDNKKLCYIILIALHVIILKMYFPGFVVEDTLRYYLLVANVMFDPIIHLYE